MSETGTGGWRVASGPDEDGDDWVARRPRASSCRSRRMSTLAGTFRSPFGRLVLSAALSALAFRRRTS